MPATPPPPMASEGDTKRDSSKKEVKLKTIARARQIPAQPEEKAADLPAQEESAAASSVLGGVAQEQPVALKTASWRWVRVPSSPLPSDERQQDAPPPFLVYCARVGCSDPLALTPGRRCCSRVWKRAVRLSGSGAASPVHDGERRTALPRVTPTSPPPPGPRCGRRCGGGVASRAPAAPRAPPVSPFPSSPSVACARRHTRSALPISRHP
jgi:hypothetical protein